MKAVGNQNEELQTQDCQRIINIHLFIDWRHDHDSASPRTYHSSWNATSDCQHIVQEYEVPGDITTPLSNQANHAEYGNTNIQADRGSHKIRDWIPDRKPSIAFHPYGREAGAYPETEAKACKSCGNLRINCALARRGESCMEMSSLVCCVHTCTRRQKTEAKVVRSALCTIILSCLLHLLMTCVVPEFELEIDADTASCVRRIVFWNRLTDGW